MTWNRGSGSASGAAGVLASVNYNPAGLVSYTYNNGTNAFAPADAANLVTPEFAAPASGFVVVLLSALCQPCLPGDGTQQLDWTLMEGGAAIAGAGDAQCYAAPTVGARITAAIKLALAAGNHQLQWAARNTNGVLDATKHVGFYAGGPAGPATMTVLAA